MKYITAKQLAEELLKNPNDIICSTSSNFEMRGSVIPQTSVYVHRYKAKIEKESFTDAFDGGSYNSDIVKPDNKSKKTFVRI